MNLRTMLYAPSFDAEPNSVVPRGIYPASLPTTLLNTTSVRFYNTIVKLNRFLFGCFAPLSLSHTVCVCVFACLILSPGCD